MRCGEIAEGPKKNKICGQRSQKHASGEEAYRALGRKGSGENFYESHHGKKKCRLTVGSRKKAYRVTEVILFGFKVEYLGSIYNTMWINIYLAALLTRLPMFFVLPRGG
jgi:hypothetical protein